MSFEEKMQTMEMIWDDLCHQSEDIKSPAWHEDILKSREQAIKEGSEEFVDWETAKKQIKNQIQ